MIRVSLANAFAKRTLRPLLEKHQATPLGINLLSTETDDIYSGMVATLTTETLGTTGVVKVAANGDRPFGLFALDKNSTINDLDGQPADLKPFAVWQGGPDAYFRIDSPAMNTGGTPAVGDILYTDAAGKLAKSGQNSATNADAAVAEIVEVVSSTRWVIRLFSPPSADVGDQD